MFYDFERPSRPSIAVLIFGLSVIALLLAAATSTIWFEPPVVRHPREFHGARAFTAPPIYRRWWNELAACTKTTNAIFDSITWYLVPGTYLPEESTYRSTNILELYFYDSYSVALAAGQWGVITAEGDTVLLETAARHAMAHAMAQANGAKGNIHPVRWFRPACRTDVIRLPPSAP